MPMVGTEVIIKESRPSRRWVGNLRVADEEIIELFPGPTLTGGQPSPVAGNLRPDYRSDPLPA